MSTQKNSYQFITPLNAARFFAALAIVIFHFGRWSYPFNLPSLQSYVLLSTTGVTLFFVLSGFIMMHVYGERLSKGLDWQEWKRFYRTRLARIVPVYLIALALAVGYAIYAKEVWTMKSLVLQALFLQAWVPHESLFLNFPGWSLSVEIFFYALFPLLIFWLSKRTWPQRWYIASLVWLLSNLVTAAVFFLHTPTEELANIFLKFFPLLHLNSFIIGIVAGLWYQEAKKSLPRLLVAGAVAVLIIDPLLISNAYHPVQHNGLLAPLFAIIIVGVAQSKKIANKVLSFRPLVIGGDASYGIYILQAPVYWWVYDMYKRVGISDSLGEEGRFFVYVAVLILLAVVSHQTFEIWGKRAMAGKALGK